MGRLAAVACLFLATATLGAQQEPKLVRDYPTDGVYWSASWLAATDEASARNVPIHVATHRDGSDACAMMANTVYRDKRVIEQSRMWVNLASHEGKGHDVDALIGGKRTPRCERYFGIECKDHAFVYDAVKVKIEPDNKAAPFRVFLHPDAKELSREMSAATSANLAKSMEKLLALLPGEKIDADEWRKMVALTAEAKEAMETAQWPKAIKAYTAVSKMMKEKLKKRGTDGLLQVNLRGMELYREAEGQAREVKNKNYTEVLKRLRKISQDFKPLAASDAAQNLYDRLK